MDKYKNYDRNFRVNAVKLGRETNFFKVSKELGIATTTIYRWRDELLKDESKSFCGRTPEQKRLAELKIALKRKLKKTELHVEIFRKASEYISKGKPMIFYFIENNLDKYSLFSMCEVVQIRTGTYHKWKNEITSPRQRKTILLEKEISSIFYEYYGIYGSAKISAELQSRGILLRPCTVRLYMRKLGLISKLSIKHSIKSGARFIADNPCIFPNLLSRKFEADEPSCVWVSGITSLETAHGMLFLTIIMDLFDEKVIGWNLSENLKTKETSLPAWEMAVRNRKIKKGLIFHSDRGPQYANKIFTRKLLSYKYIKRSMSRAGNRLDNSVPRRFFDSLKSQIINSNTLLSKEDIKKMISDYIINTHLSKIL